MLRLEEASEGEEALVLEWEWGAVSDYSSQSLLPEVAFFNHGDNRKGSLYLSAKSTGRRDSGTCRPTAKAVMLLAALVEELVVLVEGHCPGWCFFFAICLPEDGSSSPTADLGKRSRHKATKAAWKGWEEAQRWAEPLEMHVESRGSVGIRATSSRCGLESHRCGSKSGSQ